MKLSDEIDKKRQEIRTDAYAMSIGEWISLYENDEIDIHPEFQRFFRWSDKQKTDLIESILLGIPLPPIFVSQREDGIWDVVDGVQRLSTIYQFIGSLKNENGESVEPLTLQATEYLPSLEGKRWQDSDDKVSFSQQLRLLIKRTKINVSVILKESDQHTKYDLFQRLNTGGSHLSAQEMRNCILVMENKDFFIWLKNLSNNTQFQECIAISEKSQLEAYDMELALRFIIFALMDDKSLKNLAIRDVGEFITTTTLKLANDSDFNRKKYEELFGQTFSFLNEQIGDKAFKRYKSEKDKFLGGFLVSQYELVSTGIAYNLNNGIQIKDLRDKIASIWKNNEYTQWSGAGVTASRRLPKLIPLGRKVFSK